MNVETFLVENISILKAARKATLNLLPCESKEKCDKTIEQFCQYRNNQKYKVSVRRL